MPTHPLLSYGMNPRRAPSFFTTGSFASEGVLSMEACSKSFFQARQRACPKMRSKDSEKLMRADHASSRQAFQRDSFQSVRKLSER